MSTLLWWLGQNAVTIALLIPLAMVVCQLFRHRPAVQHLVWAVVLLKFVTPPVVSWPWSVQDMGQTVRTLAAPEVGPPPSLAEELALADLTPPATAVDPLDTESTSAVAALEGPDVGQLATGLTMGVWLVGAAACLARQVWRMGRHAALVRRATAARPPLTDEIRAVAQQLGLRPPRTLVARGIISPFVWCLGRPRLIWPETMVDRDDVRRARGIIAHELAHVRRGDHWVAWLELVAGVVWWWNPLFWFVRKRVREAAEMACDAMALAACPENRREYAKRLLELSAGFKSGAPAAVLGVGTGPPSSFERRLSMILSDRVSGKLSLWGLLMAGGLALGALPGWSLGQQKPAEPPPVAPEPAPKADDARVKQLEAEIQRLTRLLDQNAKNDRLSKEDLETAQNNLAKAARQAQQLSDRAKAALEVAEAQVAIAEAEFRRAQKLFESKALSQQELDVAAARLQAARAHMKQLQLDVTDTPPPQKAPASSTPEKPDPARLDGNTPSVLDLADRYLKTVADLKTARSRLARMKAAAGAVSQGEIEAAEIEFERAAKLEQFLSGFIKDAIASAARTKTVAEDYLQWAQQMAKKGYITQGQVDAAKARLEAAEAAAKQLESLLSVVPTPMK